jgi:hypothetical protein
MNTPEYKVNQYGKVQRVFFDPTLVRVNSLCWILDHTMASDNVKYLLEWKLEAILMDQDREVPTC